MKTTAPKTVWTSCSVSFLPKELSELKAYTELSPQTFSAYIRSLAQRDRARRAKHTIKLKAKAAALKLQNA